jgi:hypothetical protein
VGEEVGEEEEWWWEEIIDIIGRRWYRVYRGHTAMDGQRTGAATDERGSAVGGKRRERIGRKGAWG